MKAILEVMSKKEIISTHWAEKPYNSLIKKGIVIHEKRFDDSVKRGEIFSLLDQIIK
jgi:hypothetical protein